MERGRGIDALEPPDTIRALLPIKTLGGGKLRPGLHGVCVGDVSCLWPCHVSPHLHLSLYTVVLYAEPSATRIPASIYPISYTYYKRDVLRCLIKP